MAKEREMRETRTREAGFSLVELGISLIVMLIIMAIALPALMNGWNAYRLTSAASSVAGLLQRARFEAIHKNANLSVLGQTVGGVFAIGIDENNNGVIDPREPQIQLPGPATLINPGIAPGPVSMGPSYAAAAAPPTNSVAFDPRGTVVPRPGTPPPYIAYFGITNQPKYGFRAVTITAMGQIKTWIASANSTWVAQ